MNQTIYINIGRKSVQGAKSETHGTAKVIGLVKSLFGGVVQHSCYDSTWVSSDGTRYVDPSVAFKLTGIPGGLPVGAIESRLDTLLAELGQDAIAFHTVLTTEGDSDTSYADVYYGPVKPDDGYTFDPSQFRYI